MSDTPPSNPGNQPHEAARSDGIPATPETDLFCPAKRIDKGRRKSKLPEVSPQKIAWKNF